MPGSTTGSTVPRRQLGRYLRDLRSKERLTVRAAARMLDAMDRQIAELHATRKRMKATLKSWDSTLAATPANQPAFLLDSLKPGPLSVSRRRPASPTGRARP